MNSRAVVNKLLNFCLYVRTLYFYCYIIYYLYHQMHTHTHTHTHTHIYIYIYIKILNYITNALTCFGASAPCSGSFDLCLLKLYNTYLLSYLPTYLLTYFHTYLLTPWSRALLEKLTGLQLVKKFPAFYGTRRFITAFTSARHLSLTCASSIQSLPPHPTS